MRNVYGDNQTTDRLIDNDSLKGNIRLPVTLQQTVWVNTSVNVSFGRRLKQSTRPYQATIPMSISNTQNSYKWTKDNRSLHSLRMEALIFIRVKQLTDCNL
jgi:hypothetical protein